MAVDEFGEHVGEIAYRDRAGAPSFAAREMSGSSLTSGFICNILWRLEK
jgi:hypothetical protein